MPPGFLKSSTAFTGRLKRIGRELEALKLKGFSPLLPEVERFIKLLDEGGNGSILVQTSKELARTLGEINDAIKWLENNWPARGKPGGLPRKGTLGEALGKGMGEGVGVGAVAGAVAGSVVPGAGTMAGAATGAAVGAFAGGAYEGGKFLWHDLIEELHKLRKTIEDANKYSLLNKSAYLGGGSVPRLIRAHYESSVRALNDAVPTAGLNRALRGDIHLPPSAAAEAEGKPGQYRPVYHLSARDLSDAVVNTIAGEAYASNRKSVDAVIDNMFNRVGTHGYGPSRDLMDVARAPGQYTGYRRASRKEAEFIRERIRAIASGRVPDITGGSNEYRAQWYHGPWAHRHMGAPVIGGNRFGFNPRGGVGPYAAYPAPHDTADSAVPPHRVEGHASLDIHLHGLPPGTHTRTSFGGLFREVRITRMPHQMANSFLEV